MTRIMTAVALAVALHLAGMHSHVQGSYIAQAGFNDALGINSNPTPNSPYTLGGAVAGAGVGEPGWLAPWFGSGTVQTSNVLEGDGALQITPVSSAGRNFEAQTNRLTIEQYVSFAPGARLVVYTNELSSIAEANQGAIWQAFPNGNFNVIDGNYDGGSPTPIATGFTWTANTWYKVEVDIDLVNRTWDFYVDDVKYAPANPLGYRGNPTVLNQIRYQSEGSGAVFVDALTIVPEPPALVTGTVGTLLLIAMSVRRRLTSKLAHYRAGGCASV